MNHSSLRRRRLRVKFALLAAIWFIHVPVTPAFGSPSGDGMVTDELLTLVLLDAGCEEATGTSWMPFWLNPNS